tara:strand:+ start:1249 stop:1713 length:465 start_codon:yes stop_codon:yes gene_type:complete
MPTAEEQTQADLDAAAKNASEPKTEAPEKELIATPNDSEKEPLGFGPILKEQIQSVKLIPFPLTHKIPKLRGSFSNLITTISGKEIWEKRTLSKEALLYNPNTDVFVFYKHGLEDSSHLTFFECYAQEILLNKDKQRDLLTIMKELDLQVNINV